MRDTEVQATGVYKGENLKGLSSENYKGCVVAVLSVGFFSSEI